jgi:hypothetical protein
MAAGNGNAREFAAIVFFLRDRLGRSFPALLNREIFFMISVSFSETGHWKSFT